MKVYAVGGYYSLVGLKIKSVFSTKEKAEKYIASIPCAYERTNTTIFEWELDKDDK